MKGVFFLAVGSSVHSRSYRGGFLSRFTSRVPESNSATPTFSVDFFRGSSPETSAESPVSNVSLSGNVAFETHFDTCLG